MPRLIGKQSNNGWYAGIFLLSAIAAAVFLEYFGMINVVPGFGKERKPFSYSPLTSVPVTGLVDIDK